MSIELNKELIKSNDKLIKEINLLDPLLVILYGSYSIDRQNENSDIDLLLIFKSNILNKKYNIDEKINNLKKKIIKIFNKRIDIVIMTKTNKFQYNKYNFTDNYTDNNINFVLNIYSDGYIIQGNYNKEIILDSIIYKKF
jgi:predicted nucleotidyltransferase